MVRSSTSSSSITRLIKTLLRGIAGAAVLLLSLFVWLDMSGELESPDDIVQFFGSQDAGQALYGPLLHYDAPQFKRQIICERKPSDLVLGSSRSMKLTPKAFASLFDQASGSFYNAGGVINNMSQMAEVLDMVEDCNPELSTLVLVLDFWWFKLPGGLSYEQNLTRLHSVNQVRYPAYRNGFQRFGSLASKVPGAALRLVTKSEAAYDCVFLDRSGLAAKHLCAGFDTQGLYWYNVEALPSYSYLVEPKAFDTHFFDFPEFCDRCFAFLGEVRDRFQRRGVDVIFVEPPIPVSTIHGDGNIMILKNYGEFKSNVTEILADAFLDCSLVDAPIPYTYIDFYHPSSSSWESCFMK